MKPKANIQLNLIKNERTAMRKNKIRKQDISYFSPDEISLLLKISEERVRVLYALVDFQQIPSIGIKFAEDLVFLGYYSIEALKNQTGPALLNVYELKKGFKTDPCVEDQFWLAVDFANNKDYSKNWWSFTKDRKEFRAKNGYPKNRPETNWADI